MRHSRIFIWFLATFALLAFGCGDKKPSVSLAKQQEAQSHYDMALAYMQEEKPSQALEELEKAIAANPYDPNIHNALGLVYYHKERFDKAEAAYLKAVELDPKHSDAQHNLGTLYLYLGQTDQAVSRFNEALAVDTYRNQANSLNGLGWAYFKKQDYVRAEQYFKDVIERDRRYLIAYDNLAKVYMATGRIDDAMARLNAALEIQPLHPESNLDMGICLLRQKDQAKAREYFLKVVQVDPLGKMGQQAQEYLNLLDVGGADGRTSP